MENIAKAINESNQQPMSPELYSLIGLAKLVKTVNDNKTQTQVEPQAVNPDNQVINSRTSSEIILFKQANDLVNSGIEDYNKDPKLNLAKTVESFKTAETLNKTVNKMLTEDGAKDRQKLIEQLRQDVELKKQIETAFKHNVPVADQYRVGLEINELMANKNDSPINDIILSDLKQYQLDNLVAKDKKAFDDTQSDIQNDSVDLKNIQQSQNLSMDIHKNLSLIYSINGDKNKAVEELDKYLDLKANPVPQGIAIDPRDIFGITPKLNNI